jgi:hypothetical protein
LKENPVECTAAALGVIGGFFYPSVNTSIRIIGAVIWTVGNACWIVVAKHDKKWALFTLQAIYFAQNTFAIWNVSEGLL